MSIVNDFIEGEVLKMERSAFIFRLFLVIVGYLGVTLWLNTIRQTAAIWLVWVLIALQLFFFLSIFVVCSLRAKQCGFRRTWLLFVPLFLSRVDNWELVVIPALAVTMLILSARNRNVSAEHQHLLPNKADPSVTPVIGREIQWTFIIRHVFRVLNFDRAGTTVESGNNVKAASATAPYGYLAVESPILSQPVRLPIVHRDDFLLAASVFDEPQLSQAAKEGELLVTYIPRHELPGRLAGISHALHYVVTPRGTLDRYYAIEGDEHKARPAPEKLFGSFVWDGEIRVGLNADPKL